jgi:hypothetical protein
LLKSEISFDKINSGGEPTKVDRKMLYVLYNGRMRVIECFSSLHVTDINSHFVKFINGESPIKLNPDLKIEEDFESTTEEGYENYDKPELCPVTIESLQNEDSKIKG